MQNLSRDMQSCVEECLRCHTSCLAMATSHCLEAGVAPEHVRLMLACAEICQTAANMMLIGTPHHRHTCAECAEICGECAEACERIGGMEDCAEHCRHCAEACRRMAAEA